MLFKNTLLLLGLFFTNVFTAPTSTGSHEAREHQERAVISILKNARGNRATYIDTNGVVDQQKYLSAMKAMTVKYSPAVLTARSIADAAYHATFPQAIPNIAINVDDESAVHTVLKRNSIRMLTFTDVEGVAIGNQVLPVEFDLAGLDTYVPSNTESTCAQAGYGPGLITQKSTTTLALFRNEPIHVLDPTTNAVVVTQASGNVIRQPFPIFHAIGAALSASFAFAVVKEMFRTTQPAYCTGTLGLSAQAYYGITSIPVRGPGANFAGNQRWLPGMILAAGTGVMGVFYFTAGAIAVGKKVGFSGANLYAASTNAYTALSIGDVDPSHFTYNSFEPFNTVPDSHGLKTFWTLPGTAVKLNNLQLATSLSGNLILDSLSPFILLNSLLVDQIYASIPGSIARPVASGSQYTFPCASAYTGYGGISIGFTFANTQPYFILANALIFGVYGPDHTQCIGTIQYSAPHVLGTLGTPWLASVYTKFTWDSNGLPSQIWLNDSPK